MDGEVNLKSYEYGARSFQKMVVEHLAIRGLWQIAKEIKEMPIPPESLEEAFEGQELFWTDGGNEGVVSAVLEDKISIRFKNGVVRWLTKYQWKSDVDSNRIRPR